MRARTKVVVAVQTTVTLALAWTAVAWTEEGDLARSQYEMAYAEWLAVSEALAREHRPDLELRRLADEEAARGEAALVRHRELSAMRDEVRPRVAALEGHTRDLASRREALRREAEVPLDPELRAHEIATWTRDDAVAFRNRAFDNLREVERDVADAGTSMAATRARIVQWTEDIRAYERLLEQAEKAGVPRSRIGGWPVPVPQRIEGTVERVDLGVFLMDIDVGGDDGAVEGMTFTVYRGDKYICKVQIKTVGEHSSSAWILVETMVQGRAPARGDRVKNHD